MVSVALTGWIPFHFISQNSSCLGLAQELSNRVGYERRKKRGGKYNSFCPSPESPSKGGATLELDGAATQNLLVVSVKLLLKGNSSLTLGVEFKDKKPEVIKIHYIKSEKLLMVKVRLLLLIFIVKLSAPQIVP